MEGLNISRFGGISIEHGGRPVWVAPAKSLELLCYVLLSKERAHTCEALWNVLWPDASPVASKCYLRQALWKLNTVLPHHARSSGALLHVDAAMVRVEDEAPFWLDVGAVEHTYASLSDIPGDRLDDEQADSLRVAVELSRGELMPTWYQDWCIYERERLELIRITMLEQLMAHSEARERYARAIGYGQAILRHDRARNQLTVISCGCTTCRSDRTAAMRQSVSRAFVWRPSSASSPMVGRPHCTSRSASTGWMMSSRALGRRPGPGSDPTVTSSSISADSSTRSSTACAASKSSSTISRRSADGRRLVPA